MRTQKELLLRRLETQSRNWSHWVSAGLALGRVSTLPPLLSSFGVTQTGTMASWCLPAIIGLGAHQALSGATTVTYAPALSAGSAKVKEGEAFNLAVVVNSTQHGSAQSYKISGSVPAGISPQESQTANGRTLLFSGTPGESGTFTVRFKAYAKSNARGDSSPTYSFTLIVEPNVQKPVFSAQPGNAFGNWGGTAQFAASVSNASALQWRRNGIALTDNGKVSGSQTPILKLIQLTSDDSGASFDLVATSSDGTTVTSNPAALDVSASHFELWREQTFSPDAVFDENVAGPSADPEGDTRSNLLEFALNSSPNVVDPTDPFTRTIKQTNNGYVLELSFSINPNATIDDLHIEEASTDGFGTWNALPTTTIDQTSVPGKWIVQVPLGSAPAFVRLRAIR